jgi:hypothetical protein
MSKCLWTGESGSKGQATVMTYFITLCSNLSDGTEEMHEKVIRAGTEKL